MHADKSKTLRLLKTVKGQIEGVIKMVESDRDCLEISNQILASQSILKKINLDILRGHFTHCVKNTLLTGSQADVDSAMNEVMDVLDKIVK